MNIYIKIKGSMTDMENWRIFSVCDHIRVNQNQKMVGDECWMNIHQVENHPLRCKIVEALYVRTFSFIPHSNTLNLRKDRETDIEMFK